MLSSKNIVVILFVIVSLSFTISSPPKHDASSSRPKHKASSSRQPVEGGENMPSTNSVKLEEYKRCLNAVNKSFNPFGLENITPLYYARAALFYLVMGNNLSVYVKGFFQSFVPYLNARSIPSVIDHCKTNAQCSQYSLAFCTDSVLQVFNAGLEPMDNLFQAFFHLNSDKVRSLQNIFAISYFDTIYDKMELNLTVIVAETQEETVFLDPSGYCLKIAKL